MLSSPLPSEEQGASAVAMSVGDGTRGAWSCPLPNEMARDVCANDGRRLCSVEEMSDRCCDKGCGYDNYLLWTRDACTFEHLWSPSPPPPPPPPPVTPLCVLERAFSRGVRQVPCDSAAASLGSGALGTTLIAATTTALLRGLLF